MSNRVFSQSFSKRQKLLPAHSVEISELHSYYILQKLREINVLIAMPYYYELFSRNSCGISLSTKIP